MLTAKTEETDIIVGLSMGADDYVTKPFSMKVLMARVAAVLRRKASAEPSQSMLTCGPVVIDQSKHEVTIQGKPINLTPTEFKLLRRFSRPAAGCCRANQLMDKAMGTDVFVTDRAIDVHVTAVRGKLGECAWMVHTVRGGGISAAGEEGRRRRWRDLLCLPHPLRLTPPVDGRSRPRFFLHLVDDSP